MRYLITPPIFLMFFAWGSATAVPSMPAELDSFKLNWERYILPNGLQVLLQPDETEEEFSVEFWVHAGTRHERPGRYGLAHFFEHATPYGFRDDAERKEVFRKALTGSNARTRPDFTRYYLQSTPENLELLLTYTAQRVGADASDITGDWVEMHRKNVLREMTERAKSFWAPAVSMVESRGVFGPTHPYGHGSYGTLAENVAASVDDMRRWFRAHFRPEYTTLLVVGRFDQANAKDIIEREFGGIPGGERPENEAIWPVQASGGEVVVVARGEEPVLALSWPVAAWGSADDPALRILAQVLEERLENAEKAPAGLSWASATYRLELHQLAGFFSLATSHDGRTDGRNIASWLETFVQGLFSEVPTEGELARARAAEREVVWTSLSRLGWMSSRTGLLGRGLLFTGDPDAYVHRLERQSVLSPKEVQETALRWLSRPAFVTYVVPTTPPDEEEE